MIKELLIFHCKYNLKKESTLKADAISRSEGRENAGNGRPTPDRLSATFEKNASKEEIYIVEPRCLN